MTRWWWVISLAIFFFILYERGIQKIIYDKKELNLTLSTLEEKKKERLLIQKRLKEELSASENPAYIEGILMQNLGMVPKGQKKFIFIHPKL